MYSFAMMTVPSRQVIRRVALSLYIGVASWSPTYAASSPYASQRIDPLHYNCKDFLDKRIEHNQLLSAPDQALEFEHCFRLQNLAQIARQRIAGAVPEFYVERVPRHKLPPGATSDVPILRVVFPQRVFFDTAESVLRPEGEQVIKIIVDALKHDAPDVTLFVAGHTDPRGNSDYNYNLSVDRAYAAAHSLFAKGGMSKNLWWIGFGEDMPLVPNTGAQAWGYNRRVEFLFSGTPHAIAVWMADMQLDGLCASNSESDTARCKRELNFKRSYEAIELRANDSISMNPTPAPPEVLKPPSPRHDTAPIKPKESIEPPPPSGQQLDSKPPPTYILNPVIGRRFEINPTRRIATLGDNNGH